MKQNFTIWLIFILITGSAIDGTAQRKKKFNPKNRFNAGITLGASFAQIDGDNYVGYHQVGIQAGVRGIAKLSTNFDFTIEMLFAQKGSLDPDIRVKDNKYRQLALSYVEIPVLVHRHFIGSRNVKGSIELGASFGRLLDYKIYEHENPQNYIPFSTVEESFNRNEWSLVFGGGIYFSEHIRVFVRNNIGLSFLYKMPEPDPDATTVEPPSTWTTPTFQKEIRQLRNYQFSVNCNYMF